MASPALPDMPSTSLSSLWMGNRHWKIDISKQAHIDVIACPQYVDHNPMLRSPIKNLLLLLEQQIDSDCQFPNPGADKD